MPDLTGSCSSQMPREVTSFSSACSDTSYRPGRNDGRNLPSIQRFCQDKTHPILRPWNPIIQQKVKSDTVQTWSSCLNWRWFSKHLSYWFAAFSLCSRHSHSRWVHILLHALSNSPLSFPYPAQLLWTKVIPFIPPLPLNPRSYRHMMLSQQELIVPTYFSLTIIFYPTNCIDLPCLICMSLSLIGLPVPSYHYSVSLFRFWFYFIFFNHLLNGVQWTEYSCAPKIHMLKSLPQGDCVKRHSLAQPVWLNC